MLSDYDKALILRERDLRRDKRLQRTGISPKYWGLSWDDYEESADNRDLRRAVIGYQTGWTPQMHGGEGLLLIGPPGAGKTFAASLLGVSLSDRGAMVRFVPLAAYIEKLQRQFTLQQLMSQGDEDARMEWKLNDEWLYELRYVANLVILDDVGKEYRTKSGYAEDAFDLFLRERVRLCRPVVMTSNFPPSKWAGTYSASMASFIHEATQVVICAAKTDMRRRVRGLD